MAFIDNLVTWNNFIKFVTWNNFINLIIFIGIEAIIFYIYENFTSPYKILKSYLSEYLHPEQKLSFKDKYGEWAVVTGSTDGIGKEYAKQLAKQGLNIVLIARNKDKLIQVSEEIETKYNVKVKYIIADFSKKRIYKHIETELNNIEVGILVNNVGQMYDYPEEFANIPEEKIWDMVIVNVGACTMMTRMLVNQMKEKRKGAIINISSMYHLTFAPLSSVYAATKIYVKYLTNALQWELAPYDVTVQLVSPGAIPTNLTKASKILQNDLIFAEKPIPFVKSAIFTLGKTEETTGCWKHGIQMAISNLFPMELNAWITTKLMRYWYNK